MIFSWREVQQSKERVKFFGSWRFSRSIAIYLEGFLAPIAGYPWRWHFFTALIKGCFLWHTLPHGIKWTTPCIERWMRSKKIHLLLFFLFIPFFHLVTTLQPICMKAAPPAGTTQGFVCLWTFILLVSDRKQKQRKNRNLCMPTDCANGSIEKNSGLPLTMNWSFKMPWLKKYDRSQFQLGQVHL